MKQQVNYSIAIVILSFIAVKQLRKVGIDYYEHIQVNMEQLGGFYDLTSPEKISLLPFELREISGLTDYTTNEIACIHDEAGTIFIYNLTTDSISEQFQFEKLGDFEGLTKVGSTFYALRSNATLFEILPPYDSASVKTMKLNLTSWDHEGLCFDERENRMLIAPKSKMGKGPEYKDIRSVYAIDLATLTMDENPIISISLSEIERFAKSNHLPLPLRLNKQKGDSITALKFMPSSIAVHPITDEIYIISAVDKTMAVYRKTGGISNYMMLDPNLFNKPEGITFLPDGTMIVTNEGQMGQPTLLRFNWNVKPSKSKELKN